MPVMIESLGSEVYLPKNGVNFLMRSSVQILDNAIKVADPSCDLSGLMHSQEVPFEYFGHKGLRGLIRRLDKVYECRLLPFLESKEFKPY